MKWLDRLIERFRQHPAADSPELRAMSARQALLARQREESRRQIASLRARVELMQSSPPEGK